MKNNKGFTLIEVLSVLSIISLVLIAVIHNFGTTVSISKEESYKIMKSNIISASNDYIQECTAGIVDCDFSFDNNNIFSAKILKEKGYFKNFKSPIDGKNLEDCLIIKATKENGVIKSSLEDKCY